MNECWNIILVVSLISLLFIAIPIVFDSADRCETLRSQFNDYVRKFNKSYHSDPAEYEMRFQHFIASLREIDELNKNSNGLEHSKAQYGLTKLSDMSKSEYYDLHLSDEKIKKPPQSYGKKRKPEHHHDSNSIEYEVDDGKVYERRKRASSKLPLQVDWRSKGVIGPVENQGLCGACWAFSTVSTMEAVAAISTGKLNRLSVQEAIDCARLGNSGCAGGDICLLLDWLLLTGNPVIQNSQYPLKIMSGTCKLKKNTTGVTVKSFTCDEYVGSEDQILETLATHGPVAVAVNAITWQNYLGGVIQYHCSGSMIEMNHAVQLVGYDLTTDIPYYIVKNSWGTDFGDNGYLKLAIMVCLKEEEFGKFKDSVVRRFTWTTDEGFSVSVISYGATITNIKVPDKNNVVSDVVLGFDDLDSYVKLNVPYFGSTVGRCANRIGKASFQLDGVTYELAKNVGENHLHGGLIGFDKVNWSATVDNTKVIFSYLSPDGEEGYPGDVITNVIYEVTDDNKLSVDFIANSTKRTVVNLTNHSYFNLAGHETGAEEIYKHIVAINADRITAVDDGSIPTGKFMKVGGTPYDLRIATRLGDVITKVPMGYDNNFCVITNGNQDLNFVSRVSHPSSGRYLDVYSDQPGVQFYTSNFLPPPNETALVGKFGVGYRRHGAFCLETQNYPDAINHPNFPSAVLTPGKIYKHRVQYCFGAVKGEEPIVTAA